MVCARGEDLQHPTLGGHLIARLEAVLQESILRKLHGSNGNPLEHPRAKSKPASKRSPHVRKSEITTRTIRS
jgi:hypothetical protein